MNDLRNEVYKELTEIILLRLLLLLFGEGERFVDAYIRFRDHHQRNKKGNSFGAAAFVAVVRSTTLRGTRRRWPILDSTKNIYSFENYFC